MCSSDGGERWCLLDNSYTARCTAQDGGEVLLVCVPRSETKGSEGSDPSSSKEERDRKNGEKE